MDRERHARVLRCVGLIAAAVLSACSDSEPTREAELRALIDHAEAYAEARDRGALVALAHGDYLGPDGQSIAELEGLLRLHFLRNRSVHLLTRVTDISFTHPEEAEMTVLVAMAGRPLPEDQAESLVRADLMRIHLTLRKQGEDWRVSSAGWESARPEDFLLPGVAGDDG
jgi:hypothetical protein